MTEQLLTERRESAVKEPRGWRFVVLPVVWAILVLNLTDYSFLGSWQWAGPVAIIVGFLLAAGLGTVFWRAAGERWAAGLMASLLTIPVLAIIPAPPMPTLTEFLPVAVPAVLGLVYARWPRLMRTVLVLICAVAAILLVAEPYESFLRYVFTPGE